MLDGGLDRKPTVAGLESMCSENAVATLPTRFRPPRAALTTKGGAYGN
jgi:hypothetical protein